jgi:hypothetical protein
LSNFSTVNLCKHDWIQKSNISLYSEPVIEFRDPLPITEVWLWFDWFTWPDVFHLSNFDFEPYISRT